MVRYLKFRHILLQVPLFLHSLEYLYLFEKQVLVDLATILEVNTDDLIFEKKGESTNKKINDILSECDEKQIEFIENILKSTKDALDKYEEK